MAEAGFLWCRVDSQGRWAHECMFDQTVSLVSSLLTSSLAPPKLAPQHCSLASLAGILYCVYRLCKLPIIKACCHCNRAQACVYVTVLIARQHCLPTCLRIQSSAAECSMQSEHAQHDQCGFFLHIHEHCLLL